MSNKHDSHKAAAAPAPTATATAPAPTSAHTTPAAADGAPTNGATPTTAEPAPKAPRAPRQRPNRETTLVVEIKDAKTGQRSWIEVNKPVGYAPLPEDAASQKTIKLKAAVKDALQKGVANSKDYNGRQLAVIDVVERFSFTAKVEQITKTVINVSDT